MQFTKSTFVDAGADLVKILGPQLDISQTRRKMAESHDIKLLISQQPIGMNANAKKVGSYQAC